MTKILEVIQQICGTNISPIHKLSNKKELAYSFEVSRAFLELGYKPSISFYEGVETLVSWLRRQSV